MVDEVIATRGGSTALSLFFKGRPLTEEQKKAQKKADRERKRQEARDAAEKKKRFALTPEKKRKLRVRVVRIILSLSLDGHRSASDHENGHGQSKERRRTTVRCPSKLHRRAFDGDAR